jgi:formate dehydrogenase subunit beta
MRDPKWGVSAVTGVQSAITHSGWMRFEYDMQTVEEDLRKKAAELLHDGRVEAVLGYQLGSLPLRTAPVLIRTREEADRLVWNPLCENNLAAFALRLMPKKVAVVAKACDARSLAALVVEKKIPRESVVIIGVPCRGLLDRRRVKREVGEVPEVVFSGDTVTLRESNGARQLAFEEYLWPGCASCAHRNPPVADVVVGEPVPEEGPESAFGAADELASMSAEERWQRFAAEAVQCIRCYACREACPMCYCPECFVDASYPRWIEKGLHPSDLQVWMLVRAFHLAGRCTSCGACERACPMDIPLRLFNDKPASDVRKLYSFETGLDAETLPPLATYRPDDDESFVM